MKKQPPENDSEHRCGCCGKLCWLSDLRRQERWGLVCAECYGWATPRS